MCPPSVVGPPLDLQRLEEENLRLKTVRFMIKIHLLTVKLPK